MNTAERREVRRARALLKAGDRAGALVALGRLDAPARRCADLGGQTIFPFVAFRCDRLDGEVIPVHVCVARQAASDAQANRTNRERGQASDYPSCVTSLCATGRAMREALDPHGVIRWRGAGPNGRFERGRRDAREQRAAFTRLQARGLLAPVPSLDEPPADDDEG
jgi:hypothetical protein